MTSTFLIYVPSVSRGHLLSYDDCLEDVGKLSELFCALLCMAVVYNDTHTSVVLKAECWF